MKVLVPVKRVVDFNVKIRVKAVADYGLVGDLFELLPELERRL